MGAERRRAAACALALALAACGAAPPERDANHAAGARRVVSLLPSGTEIVVALGAQDRLVGRTVYDTDPGLAALPSVGRSLDPSIEKVVALDPDLVVIWSIPGSGKTARQLEQLGIPIHRATAESIADVRRTICALGSLLGMEARADSLRGAMDESIAAIRRAAPAPSVRVFYLVGLNPLMTAGPGTFINEMIELAGARNAFDDVSVKWPLVNIEAVIAREPDVIVWPARDPAAAAGAAALARWTGWADVAAVREGRVAVIDHELLHRPGPHIATAARTLAAAIQHAATVGVP